MSDWLTVDGRKYYEENYLILANTNTARAKARADALELANAVLIDALENIKHASPADSYPYKKASIALSSMPVAATKDRK